MVPERPARLLLGLLCCLPLLAFSMGMLRDGSPRDVGRDAGRDGAPEAPVLDLWQQYQQAFIRDGRVVDTGNSDISHTEGQGWAMLMAEHHADRAAFDALWGWTRDTLYDSHSGLFAWRYAPHEQPAVADMNNASDGDLLIAWALLRASLRWEEPEHIQAATRLRQAIRRHLVIEHGRFVVFLPGREGFVHDDQVTINLSYLVMPALRDFAAIEPSGPWEKLMVDGRHLLRDARFGRHRLPPDWMSLSTSGHLQASPEWPPRFGFEGVRIPLYFLWADEKLVSTLRDIRRFWSQDEPPAWVDVVSGATAEYNLSAGGRAIASLLAGREGDIPGQLTPEQDYYSASLLLLTRMAVAERAQAAR